MIISSPILSSESVKTTRTSMSAGSISPKRLSRTLFLNSTTRQHHLRYRINKTSSSSMTSSLINSQTSSHHHRLLSIRQRRLRSKLERLNQTRNFYSRRTTEPSPTSTTMVTSPTKRSRNNTTVYRPSFKVEKLLNDSRGMKKYLIDYDCLLLEQPSLKKPVVDQLMYDFDIDGRLPYSNRCSSGYLSDC